MIFEVAPHYGSRKSDGAAEVQWSFTIMGKMQSQ